MIIIIRRRSWFDINSNNVYTNNNNTNHNHNQCNTYQHRYNSYN